MRLSAAKPAPFAQTPTTLGEHLKKRRYELGLRQRDVAGQIGIGTWTYITWETDRAEPVDRYWPAIVELLGYNPDSAPSCVGEALRVRRRLLGLPRNKAAELMGIDEGTLYYWETNQRRP